MPDLAVVLLIVDNEMPVSIQQTSFPVILCDSDKSAAWQEVKHQIVQSGAPKVFLQFSNETIDIPQHAWNHIDWQYRRYRRLYDATDIISSVSPLACIDLAPPLPLPGLILEASEIRSDHRERRSIAAKLLYFFDTLNWGNVHNILNESSLKPNDLFALSCLYEKTNRFEEAYATSLKALSLEKAGLNEHDLSTEQGPALCDQARLWLAHGVQAARCERYEEAAAAFQMSFTERQHMDPLYYWADELMQQGFDGEEVLVSIEKWLVKDPIKEERLIRLLHRIGMYNKALERIEREETGMQHLTRIRFDCLIRIGRIAEAVLLFLDQGDPYSKNHPTDDLLCSILLADDAEQGIVSSLSSYKQEALLERAIALHLFPLAERLQTFSLSPLSLACSLFRQGHVMRSAALFLRALKDNTLDQTGYRYLGEILYYRKAYEQASGMFEYLLAQLPNDASLRTALALACLRQSEALLNESMYIFPSSVFLREEAKKVALGIKRMEQSDAITRWKWSERKNFHE
ncbi:hypothetical protein [Paenibacillus sp. SI8]|uniref:tetratricopeptide repeat protein n=1 Tax=unclassified Paenibacillus TaxID=185978 RepID=UPI003466A111